MFLKEKKKKEKKGEFQNELVPHTQAYKVMGYHAWLSAASEWCGSHIGTL